MNRVLLSSVRMDWETPQDFFDELDVEFNFTLDPCATNETAKCRTYFTPCIDGLKQDWGTHHVFMNPPYGREISNWIKKAYESSVGGALVVCLVPARTDTRWWWEYCMKGEIRFIRGRLKFKGKNAKGELVQNSATFPSAVVIFRPKAEWKPDIDENGNCRNNPCEHCSGHMVDEEGRRYTCDNCPILSG